MSTSIYLVEDNAVTRLALIETLGALSRARLVGWSDNESDARRDLARIQCDAVIVDLSLSRGSGTSVVASLRHRPQRQKVVVLSNFSSRDIQRRCEALGADRVFDKSSDLGVLVDYFKHCWDGDML